MLYEKIRNKKLTEDMKTKNPTESELEILQILWENGPSTVRFVNDHLNKLKEVGYTTTLKIMQIMNEKNLVSRKADGRQHIYKATVRKESVQKSLLDKFVENTFKGSAPQLVMQLLGNRKTSKAELDEIKALIDKIEQDKK